MTRKARKLQLVDARKVAIAGVIALFATVTLVHVATYTGSFEPAGQEWLGYAYALGGDLAIAICAWFTRWDTTRRWAWISYFTLVIVDGVFNVAYVDPFRRDAPFAAALYAIFPTLIVAILSVLARQVGALSARAGKTSAGDAIVSAIAGRLGATEQLPASDGDRVDADGDRPAVAEPPKKAGVDDWRAILASLGDRGGDLSAADVQRLLVERGYEEAAASTARRWAKVTKGQ